MIVIIYGTTGELIKLLPLINQAPQDQQFRISTQQQPKQLQELHKEAGTPEPNFKVGNGHKGQDLEKITHMLIWLAGISLHYFLIRKQLKKLKKTNKGKILIVVHGDTVTTVLGTLMGRFQRIPVAHIEAGLRSGNWRHPFPEELDRRIVSKFARIHFAPGSEPSANLSAAKARGEIIDTKYNTVLDSLRLAQKQNKPVSGLDNLPQKYFVVSIHRNELVGRPEELRRILENIALKAQDIQCIFLDHPVTKERIRALKLDRILDNPSITRLHKLSYFQFISLAAKCEFIVTDSGGLQEEAAYLGIPCLVHRLATERQEGIGRNVVLSRYEEKIVKDFLNDPEKYRSQDLASAFSPTAQIVKSLKTRGFLT